MPYPVHFQQDAGFPVGISETGVRQAGAGPQGASLEAADFFRVLLGIVLQEVLPWIALLVPLLLRVVVP